jgi:hypothetical protein
MGATRDLALNELPIRGISINPDADNTNAITVVPSDSGIIFINNETGTGTITYTLPAVADGAGKWFWFYNGQTTRAIAIHATTSILVGLDTTTGSTFTSDAVIGSAAMVIGDGTNYHVFILKGTWS